MVGDTIIFLSVDLGWLVLWRLAPRSTIVQLYRGGQLCWRRKPPTCHNISGDRHWLHR